VTLSTEFLCFPVDATAVVTYAQEKMSGLVHNVEPNGIRAGVLDRVDYCFLRDLFHLDLYERAQFNPIADAVDLML
jgi:hypothetical protein